LRSRSGSSSWVSPGSYCFFQDPVQALQRGELEGGDQALAVGGAVDPPVVHAHQVAVSSEPYVALQAVRALGDGPLVGLQGVLGFGSTRAAVSDDLRASGGMCGGCQGHETIVTPQAGYTLKQHTPLLDRSGPAESRDVKGVWSVAVGGVVVVDVDAFLADLFVDGFLVGDGLGADLDLLDRHGLLGQHRALGVQRDLVLAVPDLGV